MHDHDSTISVGVQLEVPIGFCHTIGAVNESIDARMRAMGTNVHEACITLFYILLHSMECVECWYVMVAAIAQFGTMY